VTHAPDPTRARAYLLGSASEQDADVIEQAYFRTAESLERVEAAEELLIEDYLANRLTTDERARFERHYLAVPRHRTRVETIRRLSTAASHGAVPSTPRSGFHWQWLAVAAGFVLAVGATVWMVSHRQVAGDRLPAPELPAPVPARSVYAWSLSPAAVRGTMETPALVIPAGTDDVRLQLEGEGSASPIARGRLVIRVVGGDEVWQGPVANIAQRPAGVVAIVDVPAGRLRPDDYTITLLAQTAAGVESERQRYFLRVRSR